MADKDDCVVRFEIGSFFGRQRYPFFLAASEPERKQENKQTDKNYLPSQPHEISLLYWD